MYEEALAAVQKLRKQSVGRAAETMTAADGPTATSGAAGVVLAADAAAAPTSTAAVADEGTIRAAELTLHLNLAQCGLKRATAASAARAGGGRAAPEAGGGGGGGGPSAAPRAADEFLASAIQSCGAALAIDADNAKALYRRAAAREQRGASDDLDGARDDLARAALVAPADSAVAKLRARVDERVKRQAAAERKMWGKAFA